ncbi:MAG: hypothetical protein LBB83_03345 [Treponema sp.]|jgi:hypothetical protein|nr:hypothetical protein [Treponema sp.]
MTKMNRLIAGVAMLICAVSIQAQSAGGNERGEVYVGIISFDQTVRDLTGGAPKFLDAAGYAELNSILDRAYNRATAAGTSMYYAVHQALANLSANASFFPDNLATVNIVTFTDGLDNNSTSPALTPLENQNFAGRRVSEYQSYLSSQIESRRVRGKPVTAYSVGLRGNDVDVSNQGAFMESLRTVASAPKDRNAQEITNFANLREKFQEIADKLSESNEINTFELITPAFPAGAKVRMTFDIPMGNNSPSAAANSRNYFEGEVTYTGGQYRLINIRYAGNVKSSSGQQVTGSFNQTVKYIFEGFEGYNSKRGDSRPRQWSQTENSTVWQVNSEYDTGDAPETIPIKNPTVVYLILDCSTSLGNPNIVEIRKAAKEFLDILYRGGTKVAFKEDTKAVEPPSFVVKPAAEPAPRPAPSLSVDNFSSGERIAAAALNTAFGLGSIIIMRDFIGGGIEMAGYAIGAGLIVWETMLTYEENRGMIGIPGTAGLAVLGVSFAWGVLRPFLYNKPDSSVAGVFDKVHIDLVSDRQGKPALNMTYRMSF